MSSLGRGVLSHKRFVVACWLVLTIAGVAAVGPATSALKSDPSVPDKEGWATNAAIAERYGADPGGSAPLLPVVTLPKGETVRSAGVRAELKRLDARVHRALPHARIASYASTGDETFVGGRPVRLTGFDALAADGGSDSGGPPACCWRQ